MAPSSREAGDLAIVLHSHMPYVEGFGTYPFGEEWLFDAVLRSYVPVLEHARDLTMTITPVLADQLEAPGVSERMLTFIRELRAGAAERDIEEVSSELAPAARSRAERHHAVLDRLERAGGNVLSMFAAAQREGRVALASSTATHAVLPLVATRAGRRLQVDAGLRSHARRFGSPRGFWLPECAYEPGIGRLLAEAGSQWFCVDQTEATAPAAAPPGEVGSLDALEPVLADGLIAFPIDWATISRVWSLDGLPSDPLYADFHRESMRGTRLWTIAGTPYDAAKAEARARQHATEFLDGVAERLRAYADRRGRRGLVVFAVDTELLGHWWSEGPVWLRAVLERARQHGVRLITLDQATERHQPVERPLIASSWGEGKDLSTWDSPAVADMAWGARRLELRLLRRIACGGLSEVAARRAARELLAVQASDWAFLDGRRQAGDYPFSRAIGHAEALFEVIDSPNGAEPNPRMRNLAPDLSLSPLLEP